MTAIIPLSANREEGAFATAEANLFEVIGERGNAVLAEFFDVPIEIEWFDAHDLMVCLKEPKLAAIKVVRRATNEDLAYFKGSVRDCFSKSDERDAT